MSDQKSAFEAYAYGDENALPVRKGQLRPLKTVEELGASEAVIEVYLTSIPAKTSSRVLNALRSISAENGSDLQHLRRFAKANELPCHLRFLNSSDNAERESAISILYLILGTTKEYSKFALQTLLRDTLREEFSGDIHAITVPMLVPTSQEQASMWTEKYWPTIYKKNNPFGPHPSIVSRAEQEVVQDGDRYMALATYAAQEAQKERFGEAVGAVIVRREAGKSHPVCLAVDARWKGIEPRTGPGNVTAHAAMRAIGMVAQKLKGVHSGEHKFDSASGQSVEVTENDIFMDQPLTASETSIYNAHQIAADGYLCHNLEIYLTHEPCVMCSMAILHSRFGRIIFGQRMPLTGGICAETNADQGSDGKLGLGLGLFWRKGLNWSLLGWQWVSEEAADSNAVDPETQV